MEEICISVKDLYKEYKKTISSPARKLLMVCLWMLEKVIFMD